MVLLQVDWPIRRNWLLGPISTIWPICKLQIRPSGVILPTALPMVQHAEVKRFESRRTPKRNQRGNKRQCDDDHTKPKSRQPTSSHTRGLRDLSHLPADPARNRTDWIVHLRSIGSAPGLVDVLMCPGFCGCGFLESGMLL